MRKNRPIESFKGVWESPKIVQNISPHFCDRMRWTRCAQIVFRYLPRFRTVSVAKIHWLRHLWTCERREWGRLGLKYASPLKKGKSHAIWVLSETLSPPIEKFFPEDLQLLRPPALLPTTNKPQNREGAITRIYKFSKISRVVGGLLV